MMDSLFEEVTPLGTRVRTTPSYWSRIVRFKHPVMQGKEDAVRAILRNPVQIRQSRKDPSVHLYYGPDSPYHICVVVKCLDGEGFIVTAYRAESMKEGELLWHP